VQVKKSEIQKKILKTARDEFELLGFEKSTMRSIAQKSSITTSNIYNYFKSKDTLLMEIVAPTLSRIKSALTEMENKRFDRDIDLLSHESMKSHFEIAIQFIDRHRQDLNLILFKSYGSSIQNFKEQFINRYSEIFIKQLKYLEKTGSHLNTRISRFFLHNLCSLYTNIVVEIVMHDISYSKMKEYSKEFLIFVFNGQQALIGIEDGD
jgi:AcrR family transcriptional regulator